MFFCETLAQLLLSAFVFKPLFLGLSTMVLQMSSLKLSLSFGVDSSASLEGSGILTAMARANCVRSYGTGVGDWIHIMRGIAARRLRGKKSSVESDLRWGQKKTGEDGPRGGAVGKDAH